MTERRIPVTVIGGYLGAGKTTLLNHILRNADGRRYAVLINDFGSINIDAELIENRDGETISLTNGCICCSISSGFAEAMYNIRELAVAPDRLIIEASGVSDPMKIAQYGHLPGFVLDGVIVVADAESVQRRARDKYVGRQVVRQLRAADLVLLNKIDLVSNEQRRSAHDWLRDTAPDVRIADVRDGQVPLGVLFGDVASTDDRHITKERYDENEDHAAAYETWSFTSDVPLPEHAVRAFFSQLGPRILRGKGFVLLAEEPALRFTVQLVGKSWSLKRGEPWGAAPAKTQFVLIGLPGSLNAADFTTALSAAVS